MNAITEQTWGKLNEMSDKRLYHFITHLEKMMFQYGSMSNTPDEFLQYLHDDWKEAIREREGRGDDLTKSL